MAMTETQDSDARDEAAETPGQSSIQEFAELGTHSIHGQMLGPLCFLADEAERLEGLNWTAFSAKRLTPTIGAEITGIDLAELTDPDLGELRQAILDYKVVVLPAQAITADEQIEFSERLGELEVHPFLLGDNERPEIVRLVKDAQTGGYENIWHSDVTWRERPARFGILRSIETPEVGGDTLFADMYSAYEGLSDEMKASIDGRNAVNDMANSFGMALNKAGRAESRKKYPPIEHPIVRTHDETKRPLLYVNAIFTSHIPEMERQESDRILQELMAQASIAEYQCRVRWEDDMVVIWDNQATQHYANSDYWPHGRVMERTAIKGSRPV